MISEYFKENILSYSHPFLYIMQYIITRMIYFRKYSVKPSDWNIHNEKYWRKYHEYHFCPCVIPLLCYLLLIFVSHREKSHTTDQVLMTSQILESHYWSGSNDVSQNPLQTSISSCVHDRRRNNWIFIVGFDVRTLLIIFQKQILQQCRYVHCELSNADMICMCICSMWTMQ